MTVSIPGDRPRPALAAASPFWRAYARAKGLERPLALLDDYSRQPAEARRSQLAVLLRGLLAGASSLRDAEPEWERVGAIGNEQEFWAAWGQLPILSKEDLRGRFHPRRLLDQGRLGLVSASGGSTGEPTPYLHDRDMQSAIVATKLQAWMALGWRPGLPTVCLWGSERDIGKQSRFDRRVLRMLKREVLVDGYLLDNATVDKVVAAVARAGSCVMYGFTSMLEFVARELIRRGDTGLRGRLRAAWNGGEMLFPSQSELFERATGVPLQDMYGGREVGAMAYKPSGARCFQDLRPIVHLEVVDDSGHPVAAGATGRLVVTSTLCQGTPFIRYAIGDVATVSTDSTAEGLDMPAIERLEGRTAGLIVLPDGRAVNGVFWNHMFKEIPEVERFQVVLLGGLAIDVRYQGRELSEANRSFVLDAIARVLPGWTSELRRVERLPLTREGKLLQILDESGEAPGGKWEGQRT